MTPSNPSNLHLPGLAETLPEDTGDTLHERAKRRRRGLHRCAQLHESEALRHIYLRTSPRERS